MSSNPVIDHVCFCFSVAVNEIDGGLLLNLTDRILIENFSKEINYAQRRALITIIENLQNVQEALADDDDLVCLSSIM